MTTTRTMAKAMAAVAAAAAMTACGGSGSGAGAADGMIAARSAAARIGPAGGAIETEHGVTVVVPPGALQAEVEVQVNEPARHETEPRRVELEPRGLALAGLMSVKVRAEDGDAADDRLVEIEHQGEVEVEHGIENEHEVEVEHAREVEIEHMAELELRHARACATPCDAGLECDDGVCKPHGAGK